LRTIQKLSIHHIEGQNQKLNPINQRKVDFLLYVA